MNYANYLLPYYNFIYCDLLHVFGWSPSVAAAPRWFDWPQDPAAAGLLRRWSRRLDTPERNSPHVPPTGFATNGHRRRWLSLCHSPDILLVGVAEEWYEREAGCYDCCCCVNALPLGFGCLPGTDCDHVLEEAGSCPCRWWGSKREVSPGHPQLRCHGHCLGHSYLEEEVSKLQRHKERKGRKTLSKGPKALCFTVVHLSNHLSGMS